MEWGANIFLLVGDRLTLVDTGFKGRMGQILRTIKRLGYSPADLASIIITHHHADHTGNLAELKKLSGARIIAHPSDAPYIEGKLPPPGLANPAWLGKSINRFLSLWKASPAGVDTLVNDGDELPILSGIKVLHTPGHTPGGITLFLNRERVVIVGDALSHRIRLGLPPKAFTGDVDQAVQSARKIAELDFDIICFGHNAPIIQNAHGTILRFANGLTANG